MLLLLLQQLSLFRCLKTLRGPFASWHQMCNLRRKHCLLEIGPRPCGLNCHLLEKVKKAKKNLLDFSKKLCILPFLFLWCIILNCGHMFYIYLSCNSFSKHWNFLNILGLTAQVQLFLLFFVPMTSIFDKKYT